MFRNGVATLAALPKGLRIVASALLCATTLAQQAQPTNAASPGTTSLPSPAGRDLEAARFLTTCAGCHSLSGAKLSGPELTPATAWPQEQLKAGIKKMETKVGPLSEEVVEQLASLLKSPDVRDRLKTEGERIAALFMAKMEPANSGIGRELFHGSRALESGGLACAACHVAEGRGGNLGPALNGIFRKTGGELPLISAIEQSNFKIMQPHYRRHPVTKQEAMHLGKYLSTLDPNDSRSPSPAFARAGAGIAAAGMLGLIAILKTQRNKRGRDKRLQRRRNQG